MCQFVYECDIKVRYKNDIWVAGANWYIALKREGNKLRINKLQTIWEKKVEYWT